jgi:hypothetical protein
MRRCNSEGKAHNLNSVALVCLSDRPAMRDWTGLSIKSASGFGHKLVNEIG